MKVYVVESGYYEDRGVDFVATTKEAGVAAIKALWPAFERWTVEDDELGGFTLVTAHGSVPSRTRYWHLTPYEVVE